MLAMIWARDLPPTAHAGRLRTMSFIREIGDCADARHLRLQNLLEIGSVQAVFETVGAFVWGLIRFRPVPLQVLLFSNRRERQRTIDNVAAICPDVLYLDGIRTVSLVEPLRRTLPACRIVIDFDDLMSRRMRIMREAHMPLGLGYLKSSLPSSLVNLVESLFAFRWLLCYEEVALRQAERRAIKLADVIVLVSSTEADDLRAGLKETEAAKVLAIPPPAAINDAAASVCEPVRFTFVGSDELIQNRLSIEFLLDCWKSLRPASPLYIYGRMREKRDHVEGVFFCGMVENLRSALEGSVLLVPSFIAGGVKTKVLDGFGFGCAVVGTPEAFEGLGLEDYPLVFPTGKEMKDLIAHPSNYQDKLRIAAEEGARLAKGPLSVSTYRRRWREALKISVQDLDE